MGSSCCSAKGATEGRLGLMIVTKRVIQSPDSTSKKSEHPAAPQETNQQEMEHNGDEIQEEEASAGNAGLDEFEQIDDSLIRPSNTVYPYPEILAIPVKEHLLLPSMKASPVNGLVNLGNNCHLNVVLQLLMHTPGLREYFLSNLHVKEHVTGANPFPEGVAGRIGELVQLYHSYNDTALAPHKLLETIASESSGLFDPLSKEDDAINVLCYLLQNLHHRLRKNYFGQGEGVESDIPAAGMSSGKPTLPEMFNLDVSELRLLSTGLLPNNFEENKFAKLESKGPKKNSQGKPERTAIEMAGIKSFREHLQKGSSVICDTMLGQLLHKIHCADCGFYLVQFKPFFCLELPLPEDHETTDLRQILQNMASPKEIVGRFINCPTCKGSRKMLASTEIYKLPPVLYVHFQRFVTGLPKNPTLVQVDLNGEDLSDLEAGSTESPTQNLKKIYKPFFYIVSEQ